MTIEKLLDVVLESEILDQNCVDMEADITEFRILSADEMVQGGSCLYITIDPEIFRAHKKVNEILIRESRMIPVINTLSRVFFEARELENRFTECMERPKSQTSIRGIINAASEFLDRSLVLTDLSFKVIAASSVRPVTDPIWKNNIQRGNCTYEFISAINELLPEGKLPRSNEAILVQCDYSTENKMVSQLYYEGKAIGYLILLDNNKGIKAYDGPYLSKISDQLVIALSKRPEYHEQFFGTSKSVYEKLLETPDPVTDNLPVCKRKQRCIVVRCKSHSQHDLLFGKRRMSELFPDSTVFIFKELVVAIVDSEKANMDTLIDPELLKIAKDVGISDAFTNTANFPDSFVHAQKAVQLAKLTIQPGIIHDYEKLRIYDLLNEVANPIKLKAFMHPTLNMLHEYDLVHGTQMLYTLRKYLDCGLEMKRTADALFVHRNTLTYRLKIIQGIVELNFEDPELVYYLKTSFYINDMLHLV